MVTNQPSQQMGTRQTMTNSGWWAMAEKQPISSKVFRMLAYVSTHVISWAFLLVQMSKFCVVHGCVARFLCIKSIVDAYMHNCITSDCYVDVALLANSHNKDQKN
eukprot:scaffold155548_cov15-Prasinocladus_malaysianus.AAC.1